MTNHISQLQPEVAQREPGSRPVPGSVLFTLTMVLACALTLGAQPIASQAYRSSTLRLVVVAGDQLVVPEQPDCTMTPALLVASASVPMLGALHDRQFDAMVAMGYADMPPPMC
ncbi:MAG: hypothetical protein H6815_12515 [Phycisphaeraceae bacterium]|nr:hypothetical protein [Phycisphaerales bacterium]MCB9861264.1 hypothetical protein [Phycisphaeraceae bacterium]